MLHYAAARSHGRNGLLQLLQEVDGNVGLRDGLYRTARDVAEQVDLAENVEAIDKYIVGLAARGEYSPIFNVNCTKFVYNYIKSIIYSLAIII